MAKKLLPLASNIKKFGIPQNKLSKLAIVTSHTLTKTESGATSDPRIETVNRIARALGVSLDDLVK